MARSSASCSAWSKSTSCSPRRMSVLARMRPSSSFASPISMEAKRSRHSRAGTFMLSLTTRSRNAGGSGSCAVLTWKSRTNEAGIGSGSARTACSSSTIGAVACVLPDPISTSRFTRSGWSIATRCATKLPVE